MRTRLTRVCAHCRLRASASETSCPRCARPLLEAAAGIRQIEAAPAAAEGSVERIAKWAIAIPWVLVVLGAVVSALLFAVMVVSERMVGSAMGVGLLLIGPIVMFGSVVFAGCLPVAAWAGMVVFVRWLSTRRRPRPQSRVERIWAEPRSDEPLRSSVEALRKDVIQKWLHGRARWAVLLLFAVLLTLQIGVELVVDDPDLGFDVWGIVELLVADALAILAAGFCGALGLHPTAMLLDYLREPPSLLRPREPKPGSRADWRREHVLVEGEIVEIASPCRAPICGTEGAVVCVAGDVDGHAVDDADVSSFVIETSEGERVIVRADDVLVDLEVGDAELVSQSEELSAWLHTRGLDAVGPRARREVALAEAVLTLGDRVRVWGREHEEPGASAGYRERTLVRVLSDRDRTPVLIERSSP